MDTKTFLGIEPIGQPGKADGQWAMVVKSSLVTGGQFLWGGAALAAGLDGRHGGGGTAGHCGRG